jgi:hypothetical protein
MPENDAHFGMFPAADCLCQFGRFQSLDPRAAQDYIPAAMMNDTQSTVRRRRAELARAYAFV